MLRFKCYRSQKICFIWISYQKYFRVNTNEIEEKKCWNLLFYCTILQTFNKFENSSNFILWLASLSARIRRRKSLRTRNPIYFSSVKIQSNVYSVRIRPNVSSIKIRSNVFSIKLHHDLSSLKIESDVSSIKIESDTGSVKLPSKVCSLKIRPNVSSIKLESRDAGSWTILSPDVEKTLRFLDHVDQRKSFEERESSAEDQIQKQKQ